MLRVSLVACSSVVFKCLTAAGVLISLSLMTSSALMEGRYGLFFSPIFSFPLSVYIQVEPQQTLWPELCSPRCQLRKWTHESSCTCIDTDNEGKVLNELYCTMSLLLQIIGWCLFLEAFSMSYVRWKKFVFCTCHSCVHSTWLTHFFPSFYI